MYIAFYTRSSTVHWKEIEANPQDFFKPTSIPHDNDITIKEPSRMTNRCANGLYHFWFTRQEAGRRPLQVKQELRAVEKKRVAPVKRAKGLYVEVDNAEEEEAESAQAQGAAHQQSPAGTVYSNQAFLKVLSSIKEYRQALELIKYAVCYIFLSSVFKPYFITG
jgi:hypothetical protein